MSSPILPAQIELRVTIPTVEGNVDYQQWRQQLERIDQLLLQSGLENQFVALSLEHWKAQATDPLESISVQQQQKFQEHSRRALRCNIARTLRGEAEPETDGREGLKSLELLIATYLSARDGKRVTLPLDY